MQIQGWLRGTHHLLKTLWRGATVTVPSCMKTTAKTALRLPLTVMNGSDETISIKDISQIVFTISDTPTAIGEIKKQPKHQQNRKLIKDGKLLIQRDGKTYNTAGIEEF